MFVRFENIGIRSIAACLPSFVVPIEEYAPHLIDAKQAKRFARNTGFSKLRIASEETTTADLCLCAAKRLLGGGHLFRRNRCVNFCDPDTGLEYTGNFTLATI